MAKNKILPDFLEDQGQSQEVVLEETPTEDGGAEYTISSLEEEKDSGDFDANLAELADESDLSGLANEMLSLIEEDKRSREKRDEQYQDGLKKTGLSDERAAGAGFEGASKVFHPLIIEACVDYAARTSRELLPPDGPCRMKLMGPTDKEKLAKTERERDWINYQTSSVESEYKDVLEQVLTQVPLGGSQYVKHLWDFSKNTFRTEFVPVDDMILPFHASSFIEARRKTQRMYLSLDEVNLKVKDGTYRECDLQGGGNLFNVTKSEMVNRAIEGKTATTNPDRVREIYECHWRTILDFDDLAAGEERPYIITIDKESSEILAIYRNWEEKDPGFSEIQWFVEYRFIPWRGVYAIGIYHIVGGLATALTGSLRALLDSALINTLPTGLKLRGNKLAGQSLKLDPIAINEIDSAPNVDDIRKIFMPLPFNPPSPVLFQLLGWLDGAARGVVATSEDKIADVGNQAPVGTALALIEQGSKTYSSLFERAHFSQARSLAIIYRLNKKYLDIERVKQEHGEHLIEDGDFKGRCSVMPVSDPNIFAETQRYAQMQAVLQLVNQAPQLFQSRTVFKRVLDLLRIPAPEELLVEDQTPKLMNAASENVAMSLGKFSSAFPSQDHLAHIHAHIDFATNPFLGMSQSIAKIFLPLALDHIKQHKLYAYNELLYNRSNELLRAKTGDKRADISDYLKMQDERIIKASDQYIADVSALTMKQINQIFAPIDQEIQKLEQFAQTLQPPPPPPPEQIQAQALAQEVQRKTQKDQFDAQAAMQKIQIEGQKTEADIAVKKQEIARKLNKDQQEAFLKAQELRGDAFAVESADQREKIRIAADVEKNQQDNQTAILIASEKHDGGQIRNGEYLTNPRPRG